MDMAIGLLGEYGVLIAGICVVVMFVELLVWLNERPIRKSKRFNHTVRVDEHDSICDWLSPREELTSLRDSPLPPAKSKENK